MSNKYLVVVESPSKIKTIQKYLGAEYIIRASFGHVMDLKTSDKNKLGVDLENGFKPIYGILTEKKDKIKAIVEAAKGVDCIMLATDADREGESISWNIAEILKTKIPIKRVLFNEITKKGIMEGISNPKELDKNLFAAQQARRVLDRLVGFMVSPYLMNHFGPNLSAGRVQSVAIRMVVDREREIEQFKPEEYWNIVATLAKPTQLSEMFIAKYANKITNKVDGEKIKKDLESDSFKILEVISEEKKKSPPPPLETATLQQAAALRFNFPSSKTMKLAQALYEAGLITYMRTDSLRISPEAINAARSWLGSQGYQIPDKPNYYASKDAQDAHEAIRPTNIEALADKIGLSQDETKIYKLIWERFVACQMLPAVFDTVAVTVQSSSNHLLKANGKVLKFKGWMEIIQDLEKIEEDDIRLPKLIENEEVVLVPPRVKAEQKFTQPPSRYKEHSLIKELKKRGIGRPSTYAAIMAKITDRNYVEKKKDVFYPTDLGKKVVDSLVNFFDFMQYKYTAEIEEKLDLIADGKLSYLDMMNNFFPGFKDQLKTAYQSHQKDYGFKCEKCDKPMLLKHGKYGYYLACANRPDCTNTKSCDIVNDVPVIRNSFAKPLVEGISCPKCEAGMIAKDGKFGRFYACSKYPKCSGSRKMPFGKKCDKCGNEMYATVFSGETKLACMGYPNCRNIENLPKDTKVDWIDPNVLNTKTNKVIDKVLFKSRKGSR